MSCPNCNPPTESEMLLDDIFSMFDESDATLAEIFGALRVATIVYERQLNAVLDEDF